MDKRKLLIVEYEVALAKELKSALHSSYEISMAHDPSQAKALLAKGNFSAVILDLGLPPHPDTPHEGFNLLEEIVSTSPGTRVIVTTDSLEHENAVRAIGMGAADFYTKPFDQNLINFVLERTFKFQELEQINQHAQQPVFGGSFCGMLGLSPAMLSLFGRIRQASANDYPLLITGASGTGKKMAAGAVHSLSSRAGQSLITVKCGAIPKNLIEVELFGHKKGTDAGAVGHKAGLIRKADKGTLFLDEIVELPLTLQRKLLSFLEEGAIEHAGSDKTIPLGPRVIAATNVDLTTAVHRGDFLQELLLKLSKVRLEMPDLKDRPEDIMLLAQSFLQQESRALERNHVRLEPSAIAKMLAYSWPGNVRELQNRIRRALASTNSSVLSESDLGFKEEDKVLIEERLLSLNEIRDAAEIKAIRQALVLQGNNIRQAAKLLRISRPTLYDLLKKHGIKTSRKTAGKVQG